MSGNAEHKIDFVRLTKTAQLPTQAHSGDAGWDLYADYNVLLRPGMRECIGTGIAIAMNEPDMMAMVCPRSGYAAKYGVTVLNAPGIIDSGYRGEIVVILQHCTEISYGQSLKINRGDKIAQLVFVPVYRPEWIEVNEVEELGKTDRGQDGFGSSGR